MSDRLELTATENLPGANPLSKNIVKAQIVEVVGGGEPNYCLIPFLMMTHVLRQFCLRPSLLLPRQTMLTDCPL